MSEDTGSFQNFEEINFFHDLKMNNKKTCYKQNNEKLKEYARNRYHSLDGKTIAKKNYENNIEKLQKQAQRQRRNLSEEERKKKRNT